jgi:type I restriction enzyme S subunit
MSSEWRTVKFSQAIELIGGGTPRTSEPAYWDGDIPWLSVADFNNVPRWVVTAEKKITKLGLEQSSTKLLSPGDVIISARGTVGAIAQVSKPMAFNQSCYGVRGLEGVSQTDFIFYALKHAVVELKRVAHGAVFDTITRQTFENIELQLPSLADQEQIASILGCLDERITLLLETNTTLEAIAQALFKSWFVDFDPVHAKMQGRAPEGMDEATAALFPDNFEESELGPVPKGWRIGRLDDLLVLQRGFDLPAQDRTPGDFPIIAASGPSGTHHKSMVKGPGVVTGRSGVLGRVFLELEDFWPLNTTLWVKEFKAATPCYAYEVLRLLDFKSFNAGSAVPSLNRNHIHGLPYLLPERACIEAFENITLRLHERSRGNADQIQTLEAVREKLLPRLISGQISLAGAIT